MAQNAFPTSVQPIWSNTGTFQLAWSRSWTTAGSGSPADTMARSGVGSRAGGGSPASADGTPNRNVAWWAPTASRSSRGLRRLGRTTTCAPANSG